MTELVVRSGVQKSGTVSVCLMTETFGRRRVLLRPPLCSRIIT